MHSLVFAVLIALFVTWVNPSIAASFGLIFGAAYFAIFNTLKKHGVRRARRALKGGRARARSSRRATTWCCLPTTRPRPARKSSRRCWTTRTISSASGPSSSLAIASIAAALVLNAFGASTDRIYYGTDTRAVELLLGALAAVVLPATTQLSQRAARAVRRPDEARQVAQLLAPLLVGLRELDLGLLGAVRQQRRKETRRPDQRTAPV